MLESAVLAAVVAALVSVLVATRNNYMQAVTAERSKWIDKLRENISTFSGKTRTFSYKIVHRITPFNSPEYVDAIDEINKLIALIKLQLNPKGEVDGNLIRLLDKIPSLADNPSDLGAKLRRADNLLIQHAQWLLKDEWEKVKRETNLFGPLFARARETDRQVAYKSFCKRTGIEEFLGEEIRQ